MALPGIVAVTHEPDTTDLTIRPELLWDPERLAEYPWLTDLVQNIPDDANPPMWMSPPPADAVGSYGIEAAFWIEQQHRITLRWWQRLAVVRQLEHRADGTLCCETYIESAPRRAGKSVRMRGVATWRLADPLELFGEVQLVMHTGNDLATCREIQRGAWKWAESIGWNVTRANGKEAVETPDEDRWLTRSQDAVYGYDVCLGMVDESWDVKPETVFDGIEPAMLDRIMPQLSLTSTAHPRTTSLMPTYIRGALTTDDPTVVLLVWCLDPAVLAGVSAADRATVLADPAMWRAASPYWSDARAAFIASKWERARAAKPTPDNPDPIRTFEKQYLNVWTLDVDTSLPGEAIVTADLWKSLTVPTPTVAPTGAAIESWSAEGVSLVLARPAGDGQFVVTATDHPTIEAAVAALKGLRYRRRVIVGSSLTDDPALRGLNVKSGEKRTGAAVQAMAGLLRERAVLHDGSPHLTEQVLEVRTLPGTDGPRLVSKNRADAVKAAVWAVTLARTAPARRARIITAA